jgi:recombinational DNA repair ATPase RecF
VAFDYETVVGGSGVPEIDFRRITLLFGPNGVGKTNVLEAGAWTIEESLRGEHLAPAPRRGGSAPHDV